MKPTHNKGGWLKVDGVHGGGGSLQGGILLGRFCNRSRHGNAGSGRGRFTDGADSEVFIGCSTSAPAGTDMAVAPGGSLVSSTPSPRVLSTSTSPDALILSSASP